ncbi:MAG: hypothetical protein ACXU9C_10255 [Xanthobacteraceae bacterium]
MTLGSFLTFLTFLTQALCFPPYLRREGLGPPQTVPPEGEDLTERPESASEVATSDRRGHDTLDFKQSEAQAGAWAAGRFSGDFR